MATITDNAFAFDPRSGPSIDTVVPADPMALPSSFSSFFDDAFLAQLSFTQSGNPDVDSPFYPDDCVHQDTLDSDMLLDKSTQSIPRDGVRAEPPEGEACQAVAVHIEDAKHDDEISKPITEPTRYSSKGGSKRSGRNESKKQSSARGHPREATGAEEARKKRERTLEKNRLAANKFRQKKKDWMAEMDNRHRCLKARNRFLKANVASLSSMIIELKEMMFQHLECGYAPIEDYVKAEADKVQVLTRLRGYAWTSIEGSLPQQHLHSDISSTFNCAASNKLAKLGVHVDIAGSC